MNIQELDTYDLGDAVKFNNRLNPRLFDPDERLRPEVREQLMAIAEDFKQFLGVKDLELKDITVSGSNAAYTYTPHSDIDLHLVVDLPEADASEVYRELFDAKKYAYNDQHNITIGGYDVELYVQDANKTHHSQGIYSVLDNDWVAVPKRRRPDVDDISVKSKFEDLGHRIEDTIATGDYEKISAMADKIKTYRQAGLDAHGEFGPENLAFKILRKQGLIEKLYAARNAAKDQLLSLDERRKKKRKVRYGYGAYWYPGTAYAGQDHPAGTEGGDGGGGDGGGESIRESVETTDEDILRDFVDFCVKELKIKHMPRVKLRRDPQWPAVHKTFGRYNDENKTLEVAWGQRHIMDVLRTVAHELTHKHQHEREGHRMGPDAGETGSPYENEANARAGVLMRDYGRLHPEYFTVGQAQSLSGDSVQETAPIGFVVPGMTTDPVKAWKRQVRDLILQYREDPTRLAALAKEKGAGSAEAIAYAYIRNPTARIPLPPGAEVKESASGYIPTKAQARDPRFSMALTVDIKPGQVGKEANKLKLRTDRQGHPQIARANGLFEALMAEYQGIKEVSDERLQSYLSRADRQVSNRMDRMSQARERLNKGYEIYDAEDPTRIVHRFEADTPAEARRYYEQYNVNYESDQDYDLRLRRSTGIMEGSPPPGLVVKKGGDWSSYPGGFQINAFLPNDKHVGMMVVYPRDDGQWIGEHLIVDPKYQRQGIGTALWDFAEKTVGGRVIATNTTPAGKKFQRSRKQAVAEDKQQQYLWHGSTQKIPVLTPRQAHDTGGAAGSNQNAIYATADKNTAIKMGMAERGSDTAMFDQADQLVLFSGRLRRGKNVYLHQLPRYDANGQDMWSPGGNGNEFYTKPEVKEIQPLRVIPVPVDGHLDLVRKPTAKDLKLRQKYLHQARLKQRGITEDEDLDEVKMSPSALEKFATSPAAKGIRAGFEAELIFRDTQGSSDDIDPEPDYDADERAYSIQQVIDFFSNDDYGYGLSDREQMRLTDNLDETYMTWRDEQMISDFRNDAEDLIREKLLDETPWSERIHLYLTDSEQMSDKEADKIIAAGVDAPKFNTSKDQAAYAAENPYYQAYLDAADAVELELDESVEYSVSREDEYWDEALDDYRDNYSGDDDSFFSDVGLRWMSDIANEFGLDWPVWNMDSDRNNGSRSWEDIGSELQAVVDMPVVVSDNYHSTRRRPGQWIIEPDGSLHPDDQSEEAGLEIVSPPMPLLTAIEKLRQVTDWANDPSGGNAYTNGTTGLHMGVSLPTMKSEDTNDDIGIDYVKLILFMGDKYVQQQFGREANNFCASALGKLQQNIKGKRSDPAGVVELLRHGLTELAYRELQKGVGTSKYTSAHIQNGYIEFRSPGGDWLAKSDEEIGILENTMLRFARAMAIAGDPSAERQEYAKKLYKLVTQDNEQYADQLRLFSEFSAGTINREQLKKQWAEKTLDKDQPGRREKGEWTVIDLNTRRPILQPLYDETRAEAWERAKESGKLAPGGRYDVVPYNSGRWEIYSYDVDDDSKEQRLEIVDADNVSKAADLVYDKYNAERIPFKVRPYYGDVAATPAPKLTPRAKLAKRIVEPKAQPQAKEQQARNERGVPYWEIYEKETGHVVHTLLSDDSADAATDAYNWLTSIGAEQPNLFAVRAKMIPNPQDTDAKKDSADLQRSLGVQDVEPNIAQNFEPRRQNYELVSDEDPDRVLHRMNNATADEVRAWIAQQEAGGMPPGFLRTRIVAESTGQHDDEQTQTALDMAAVDFNYRNWADVEMRGTEQAKTAIRRHAVTKLDLAQPKPFNMLGKSRSAIGKGVDQVDREFINKQIQTARKLGDDVNENFADGKVKGKSRPGRVKRAGASCAGSVTSLRARAKNSSGEKAKMYHWCANMKAGRKK